LAIVVTQDEGAPIARQALVEPILFGHGGLFATRRQIVRPTEAS
jgi:hypothetical protein